MDKNNRRDLRAEIEDMIKNTVEWAKKEKFAYRDDDGVIQGFFTVDEWCERFNYTRGSFALMKDHMKQQAIPIALYLNPNAKQGESGHFIGHKGEQATGSAIRWNYLMSSAKSLKTDWEAFIFSGQQQETSEVFNLKSKYGLHSLRRFFDAIEHIMLEAGEEIQLSFARLLMPGLELLDFDDEDGSEVEDDPDAA